MTSTNISPKAYREGFQASQIELEAFMQINNRLKSIKAVQQLKRGELFLDSINPEDFLESDWAA